MPDGAMERALAEAAEMARAAARAARALPRRLPRVARGPVDPPLGPFIPGRPFPGGEVATTITGQPQVTVRVDELTHYTVRYRREFHDAPAAATVLPTMVDGEAEHRAIVAALEESRVFWGTNDPDARMIRAADGLPREAIQTRQPIRIELVFTLNRPDYGAGSGGAGGAKVFWGPYSVPGRAEILAEHYATAAGVDPMYVLCHELHHAYGYGNELDMASDVLGVAAHLRSGLQHNPRAVLFALSSWALRVKMIRVRPSRWTARAAAAIRYLYRRFPDGLRRLLTEIPYFREPYFTVEEWRTMLEYAHRAARP